MVAVTIWAMQSWSAFAQGALNGAARAENAYEAARANYQARPGEAEAIKFATACIERADIESNGQQKIQIAREGIAAMRNLLRQEPNNAAAHYYLALNLGQVAQIKRMSGLQIVKEMETELLAANRLDEKLDYAGPDRCLGLIYKDAPGWPISVGSKSKTRQHFLHATELFPMYPDNRLCLIEAYLKWGDRSDALKEASVFRRNLALAKSQYSGPQWDSAWRDWQERWNIIQNKLG